MKQATKRFLSMLLGLVFFAGAFVIYFYYTRPVYEAAIKVRADLYGRRDFIAGQQKVVEEVEKLIAGYEDDPQGERALVDNALPPFVDYSSLLAQAEGMARNNNLTLQSISLSAQANRSAVSAGPRANRQASTNIVKPLGTIAVSLSIDGDYEDFKNFIEMLETNLRIFEVRSMSISPKAEKSGDISYGFSLEVITYYQTK